MSFEQRARDKVFSSLTKIGFLYVQYTTCTNGFQKRFVCVRDFHVRGLKIMREFDTYRFKLVGNGPTDDLLFILLFFEKWTEQKIKGKMPVLT